MISITWERFRRRKMTLADPAGGAHGIVPIDLYRYIRGDPPHPLTILDGLSRLVGRLEARSAAPESPGRPSHHPTFALKEERLEYD